MNDLFTTVGRVGCPFLQFSQTSPKKKEKNSVKGTVEGQERQTELKLQQIKYNLL